MVQECIDLVELLATAAASLELRATVYDLVQPIDLCLLLDNVSSVHVNLVVQHLELLAYLKLFDDHLRNDFIDTAFHLVHTPCPSFPPFPTVILKVFILKI